MHHSFIHSFIKKGQKKVTYNYRRIVPLFVGTSCIGVDAIVNDLESGHANSLHGAEVGFPEPTGLGNNKWHGIQIFVVRAEKQRQTD